MPPVNVVGIGAPFRWLALGWRDFKNALLPCLIYGAGIAGLSFTLWRLLIDSNLAFWALILSCDFVFIAPMLAMGLYEAGRLAGSGRRPTLSQMILVREAVRPDIFYLGLTLLLLYLLWGRVAQVVYGLSTYRLHTTVQAFADFALRTPEGHVMLISGTIIGGVLAFFAFSITVISAPMLLDRNADAFGAMFSSLQAVSKNFLPLMLWAALIALLLILSAATSWLALVIVFPWLGLASWRAYCDLIGEA